MENMSYKEFLFRMGYFRNQKNFSMRDLSFKLDKNESYIIRIENDIHKITVEKFLEWLEILDMTPQEFFFVGKEFTKEDKELVSVISKLSAENKKLIYEIASKIK